MSEDLDIDDLDKLEQLLAEHNSSEDETVTNSTIKNDDSFLKDVVETEEIVLLKGKENKNKSKSGDNLKTPNKRGDSFIHSGDTDSSDDEEKKNFLERKYSDYGLGIKKILQQNEESKFDSNFNYNKNKSSFKTASKSPAAVSSQSKIQSAPTKSEINSDVYYDPIFGIRIIRPLISGAQLKERMQGRDAIGMSRIKRHVAIADKDKDWVIAGAIVRKSATQESKKGAQYCIWTLSDLKDDLKTVSVFLFRNAYKELWKTNQGSVVGILNPSILDKRDGSGDEACLSVDNPDRVMLIGTSKDFGFCKSKKNNGEPCTAFVNMNQCEYCIYHVKQQYKSCSNSRSELQSKISGRGLVDLQNKLLGKNTVIYGGKSYSAIPATKSVKQTKKDANRMKSLSEYFNAGERTIPVNKSPITTHPAQKKYASMRVEVSVSQRLKDMKRLEFLQAGTSKSETVLKMEKNMESPKSNDTVKPSAPKITENIKPLPKNNGEHINVSVPTLGIPMLGFGLKKSSTIDLSAPITNRHAERAKQNALKWIQRNGPLKKNNPHNLKGSEEGKKRNLNKLNSSSEACDSDENNQTPKKPKTGINSENFQKMLAATSAHTDLIVQHDDSEADKYFDKLEKKEKMEEKMLSTYKVACKAVRCLKCSYTSFSAADRCKQEKHPLKVFDAIKRFFKCSHCSNRIVSLEIIPTQSCKNCYSSSWQRTGMIAEKKGLTTASKLSITGGEEFLGHVDHGADINLLVPEDFK